jgi:hypothetical protein
VHIQSIMLLLVITLGGGAVLGSYVLGLRDKAGGSAALWGGVPARVRLLYTVSMLISVVGYFAVLYYVFFELDAVEVTFGGRLGFWVFFPIFVLILFPSALWLPLTKLYLKKPGVGRWVAVRSDLLLVGLASIAMAWAFFALDTGEHGVAYWLATVGSCYFAFHTFVLDGLVWAALSRKHS